MNMNAKINRREFMVSAALAPVAAAQAADAVTKPTVVEKDWKKEKPEPVSKDPVAPNTKGTLPMGKIGKLTISRLISGGNLLSGWCHQRDLLFVRNLAGAYLTEAKQFDTLQMVEESGVNTILIDSFQLDLVNQYRQQRGGKIQTIAAVPGYGDCRNLDDLKEQVRRALEKNPGLLFLHGGFADRLVESGQPERLEWIGEALEFIRQQGFSAGLGAHALEVPKACDRQNIQPDFYVKTFHHDRYWSATPKERRKPFCVDGSRSLDHNEFHDNIFCLDAEATAEYMRGKPQPWIAFKVLAAGAIPPESGFKYAFENGADFIAVGMFDFEVNEDLQAARQVLDGLQRARPWRA